MTRLLCIESVENIFRALIGKVDNHITIYHFNGIRANGLSEPARLTRRSSLQNGRATIYIARKDQYKIESTSMNSFRFSAL
jgi:hypothetical protein